MEVDGVVRGFVNVSVLVIFVQMAVLRTGYCYFQILLS